MPRIKRQKKNMIILIFGFVSLILSIQLNAAGSVGNVKVVKIRVDLNGKAMIHFDSPIGGTPASCVHPAYQDAFGIDASTAGGKAVLSMALTAKATGAPVTVYGMGVCGIYGGTYIETWSYGVMQ